MKKLFYLAVLLAGCSGGWVEENSPSEADLYGVYGLDNGMVFAVGAEGTVLLRERGRWRKLRSDSQATLWAVWGSSESDVLAVGENCAALRYSGPVEQPDGGQQLPDLVPVRAATCGNFRDIDGPAGGGTALVVGERTVAQRYSGGGLSNDRSFAERLLGVSMQAEGQAFAVGEGGVFYWRSGGGWQRRVLITCGIEPQGGECPVEYRIQPVLWDVFVGTDGSGAVVGAMGGVWSYPPPAEGEWSSLRTEFDADLRAATGYLDGATQKTVVFAAGLGGVLVRIDSQGVRQQAPGTHQDLYGIWASPKGSDIYAVGARGTILHFRQ